MIEGTPQSDHIEIFSSDFITTTAILLYFFITKIILNFYSVVSTLSGTILYRFSIQMFHLSRYDHQSLPIRMFQNHSYIYYNQSSIYPDKFDAICHSRMFYWAQAIQRMVMQIFRSRNVVLWAACIALLTHWEHEYHER